MKPDCMNPILVEPSDTFFFRDSIPMSAGQGRGAGARLPLPSTFHEALRASLFEKHGRSTEPAAFRPKEAPRTGGWLGQGKSVISRGSKDYQSLQVAGPLPYLMPEKDSPGGLHFPLPLDVVFDEQNKAHTLQLLALDGESHSASLPAVTVSPAPARKDQPSGFLSAEAMNAYLRGDLTKLESKDALLVSGDLFEPEYRIGVAIDESSRSAASGQLYSATHARPADRFRFAAWTGLKNPLSGEDEKLQRLDFLILGGERRISRIYSENVTLPVPALPSPTGADGPAILRWSLVTPAVFAHGSLPGWCRDTSSSARPTGQVCLPLPSGRAHLIATCQGKPLAFAGWDVVAQQSKPTQLAVPAGSVFYFLCENAAVARELGTLLHWRPRSDVFGEKGFGYGLCSYSAHFHPTSPDVRAMATKLFT
jgi:CRISPR-associated protein Cmr3